MAEVEWSPFGDAEYAADDVRKRMDCVGDQNLIGHRASTDRRLDLGCFNEVHDFGVKIYGMARRRY